MDVIIERLLNHGTVELSVVHNAPQGEEFLPLMKDFILELCTKLDEKTFLLPLEGNAIVSEATLNHFKNALELENHSKLAAAVGVTVRVVQKYLDLVKNQVPSTMFTSMLNCESCGSYGFLVPVQGMFGRLNTLENKFETLSADVNALKTDVHSLKTDVNALKTEVVTLGKLLKKFIKDSSKSPNRKRARGEESEESEVSEEIIEERSDDDEGDDAGVRANPPSLFSASSTPGKRTVPTPMQMRSSSSSSSSTNVRQSAAKRPKL